MGAINSHMVRLPPRASGHRQCCGRRHLPYQVSMVKALTCLWYRHLPYPNKTTQPPTCIRYPTVLWVPTIILYPPVWATSIRSIRTLSLSIVRPSPSSIKGNALSPNKGDRFKLIQVILDSLDRSSSLEQNRQVRTASTRSNT